MIYEHLANKTAIVTGGTKGIGKAIVKKLLQLNVNVAITYANDDAEAKKFEQEIIQYKNQYIILKSDVSKVENTYTLYDSAEKHWGTKIDFLVNNAGVLKQGNFYDIDEDEWSWTIDTNLKGPFFLSQEFLKRYNNANIVNLASIGGQIGGDKAPHYATSKAALIGLTRSLAKLGSKKNIRVNAVAPGWIMTDIFTKKQLQSLKEKAKQEIPLGRMGAPKEVASSVVFLLSDESSFITGHCLNINGGMYFG